MIEPDKLYRPTAPELRVIGEVQTLARLRHEGKGPRYMKPSGRVLYRGADILSWLNASTVETAA